MVFVEFTDGKKTKLTLVEKSEAFLERTSSDVRKEIQVEIGELLPSLAQESINVLGKCAAQVSVPVGENHFEGYPENIFPRAFSVFGSLCY